MSHDSAPSSWYEPPDLADDPEILVDLRQPELCIRLNADD